jgi:hypothetical protein
MQNDLLRAYIRSLIENYKLEEMSGAGVGMIAGVIEPAFICSKKEKNKNKRKNKKRN